MINTPRGTWLLAFVTAFITLGTQILVHRIITLKLLNNYAFLVISLTMFGFAFSGIILSKHLDKYLSNLNEAVTLSTSSFIISLICCTLVFYSIPLGSQDPISRSYFLKDFFIYMPLALFYSIPFIFCGLILGALLSSKDFPTRKIYFFDLIGSAAGALVVLPMISCFGVENNILIFSWLFLLVSFILFPPVRASFKKVFYATVIFLVVSTVFHKKLFTMKYPKGSMLSKAEIEYVVWDPIARIEVSKNESNKIWYKYFPFPTLIGSNYEFFKQFKKVLTQNQYAFTFALDYDGRLDSLKGIEETIYSAAYQAYVKPQPKVLVIGVGGGFDILTGLYFKASQITGVEINAATIHILKKKYKDYFRHWVNNPRVSLINAEGRYFLATTKQKFDVIQLSGVDTYAGTAASANIFSESYVYTREAMAIFLSKLTDQGIINMMRLEFIPPREMLRALTTAVSVLREVGVKEPHRHIVTLSDKILGNFTSLLVKKTPFKKAEIKRLQKWTSNNKHIFISSAPLIEKMPKTVYQYFLLLKNQISEEHFIDQYPFNVRPVNDDSPFFFKYSFWWHLFSNIEYIKRSIPVMEYSLLILIALIGFAVILCIYLPLRMLYKKNGSPSGIWRYGVVLASIGAGYMAIEIALMQKFGLFLGHPNYAISVVLASILFSTGVGSILSGVTLKGIKNVRCLSYALSLIILSEYLFAFPQLPGLIRLNFVFKLFVVFALVSPIGMILGVFMPAALDQLKKSSASYVPWAWGINGIFSVLAPILCVGVSISFGISILLLSAIPIYLIAGFFFRFQKRVY